MRIREIEIENYRGFEHFTCQFSPGVNVLIGRNGAGKTTLIHALHKAVSFIFSNDRSLGKEFLSQGNNTLNVRSFKEADYHFNLQKKERAPIACIRAKADYGEEKLEWKLYRRNQTNAALYQSYYKEAFAIFMHQWKDKGTPLPLLAYYSDSYPHVYVKTVKYALDIVNGEVMPRNFGYYQWDEEAACTSIWETRMCNILNKLQPYYTLMLRNVSEQIGMKEEYGEENLSNNEDFQRLKREEERMNKVTALPIEELNFVMNRLVKFAAALPGIKEDIHEIDFLSPAQTTEGFQLSLHFKDSNVSLLQDLPAGYRRLYSIVFDMAYRSYILNGNMEPHGIAIIDEIDLHLHPELEKNVLNVFKRTFPQVQFIVSTHSPMAITNLQENGEESRILRMEMGANSPTIIKDIYGLDYNTGVEDVMGVEARNVEIESLLDTLVYFEENDLKQQNDNLKKLLLGKLNGNEARLESMIAKRRREMGDEIHRQVSWIS